MNEIILILEGAIAYTNGEYEKQPDGLFESAIVRNETIYYCNAIIVVSNEWQDAMLHRSITYTKVLSERIAPLLIVLLNRLYFIMDLYIATRNRLLKDIEVQYEESFNFCMDVLRFLTPGIENCITNPPEH